MPPNANKHSISDIPHDIFCNTGNSVVYLKKYGILQHDNKYYNPQSTKKLLMQSDYCTILYKYYNHSTSYNIISFSKTSIHFLVYDLLTT